jgi:hypothetical protein
VAFYFAQDYNATVDIEVNVGTKVICRMCSEKTLVIRKASFNSRKERYELECGHTNTLYPWEVEIIKDKRRNKLG